MANLTYITNINQLNKELSIITEDVLDDVSDKLLKDFQQHLDDTIYAAPIGDYSRYYKNGGFYSGWMIDRVTNLTRSLVFDGMSLVAPSNDMANNQMSHGGRQGEDVRDMLAGILNDANYNDYYSYSGGAKYLTSLGNGYWDTYFIDIDEKIEKWLNVEFKKYGIVRR